MQINPKENPAFLGHKRKDELIKNENSEIIQSAQKHKKKSNKKLLLKKPELNDVIIKGKKIINLDENKEEKENIIESNHNQTINSFSINTDTSENKVCEKCGVRNNVITFNSFRSIQEYFTDNKIINLISEKFYMPIQFIKFFSLYLMFAFFNSFNILSLK